MTPARPVPLPLPWAQGVMAAAHGLEVPAYGSPEFHALPPESPARAASAVLAAEVWRYEQETMVARLRIEVAEARRVRREEEEAGYRAIADALPRSVFLPPPAKFSAPRPVRQTDDWPPVTVPGRGLPSTAAMIRRVS